jgi:hypothetical protein
MIRRLIPGVEVMEALAFHPRRREEGVGLLVQDGHVRVEGVRPVLALVDGVMPERLRDDGRLVHVAGADRAGVDLDEPDDVGVFALDEPGDAGQDPLVAAEIASARDGEVESSACARGVADVIEQKAHQAPILRLRRMIRKRMR